MSCKKININCHHFTNITPSEQRRRRTDTNTHTHTVSCDRREEENIFISRLLKLYVVHFSLFCVCHESIFIVVEGKVNTTTQKKTRCNEITLQEEEQFDVSDGHMRFKRETDM